MELRDKSLYGIFTANSDKGRIRFEYEICGFGNRLEVYKDGECIFYCEDAYEEESYINIKDDIIYGYSVDYGDIEIYRNSVRRSSKPLIIKVK